MGPGLRRAIAQSLSASLPGKAPRNDQLIGRKPGRPGAYPVPRRTGRFESAASMARTAGQRPDLRFEGVVVAHIYPRIGILAHDLRALRNPPWSIFPRSGRKSDRRLCVPQSWLAPTATCSAPGWRSSSPSTRPSAWDPVPGRRDHARVLAVEPGAARAAGRAGGPGGSPAAGW